MVFGVITAGVLISSSIISVVTFGVRKARRHHRVKRRSGTDESSPSGSNFRPEYDIPGPNRHTVATPIPSLTSGESYILPPRLSSNNPFSDTYRVTGTAAVPLQQREQQQQQHPSLPLNRSATATVTPAHRNLNRLNNLSLGASESTVVEHQIQTHPEIVI